MLLGLRSLAQLQRSTLAVTRHPTRRQQFHNSDPIQRQRLMAHITGTDDLTPDGLKWLKVQRIRYQDQTGRNRTYEAVQRATRRGEVDGVAMLAVVQSKSRPPEVVLETQFRPALGKTVIELPAGLIDAGEGPAEAAARELREETGLHGECQDVSMPGFNDPGITNANCQLVRIHVDGDLPENAKPQAQLDEGEFIDVFRLPLQGLYARLQDTAEQKGYVVDARLLSFAFGLHCAEAYSFLLFTALGLDSAGRYLTTAT